MAGGEAGWRQEGGSTVTPTTLYEREFRVLREKTEVIYV